MRGFSLLGALAAAALPLGSLLVARDALAHQGHQQGAAQALYATKAEAEAAAKRFHCTGTHQMGDKWMPCAMTGGANGH